MKRLLAAGFVIALTAVLLNFPFTRSTRQPVGESTPQAGTPQTDPHSGPHAPAPISEIPQTAAAHMPSENPARAEHGVTLNVQGLAPIPLGSRNDAPMEKKIDAVTQRADLSDAAKAQLLIRMLPGLPPEVLSRATEEAATRLPDADYAAALRPTLVNPQTHGMTMSVLFADLMQRPDAIALPILAAIAQEPKHPYARNAQENLQFLLKQDFGSDWAKWDEAIRVRLASPSR